MPGWWDRLRRKKMTLWYHEGYRLPMPALESAVGFETRRSDLAAWFLLDNRIVPADAVRTPVRIRYEDVARVHPYDWIASLDDPDRLARVFQLERGDVPVEEVLATVRLACGGTLGAARETLRTGEPALNLQGGFHHAAPRRAAGFCPFNDIAIAIATLRDDGWGGQAVVLDFDAHPPDGTAESLAGDPKSWIGSLSGSDWGPLRGVDETVLRTGCDDDGYMSFLEPLLDRMPRPDLVFVIAGGDVLAQDRLGVLGLTLDGVRRRDLAVLRAIGRTPSVWLSGGGYHPDTWKVLAGTGMALALGTRRPIPQREDPMAGRFARIALHLEKEELTHTLDLSKDLDFVLGGMPHATPRFLGYYTAEGLELKLERFGILGAIRRLGYSRLHVTVEPTEEDDHVRLRGRAAGHEHLLIEMALHRQDIAGRPMLFINWLTLRHPVAAFSPNRPKLPGQQVPGLGLLVEVGHLLEQMVRRLQLEGLAFRPAGYHVASMAPGFSFVDPRREGRFRALKRDLGRLALWELTRAIDAGHVELNGSPYAWEPDDMAILLDGPFGDDAYRATVDEEMANARFTLVGASEGALAGLV